MGNKDMGESYMIQDKFIKNLLFLGVGVAKQFRVSMRCPKSRFPILIIVFDELELIIFVSQGLTLSTASLVCIYFFWKHRDSSHICDIYRRQILLILVKYNQPYYCQK